MATIKKYRDLIVWQRAMDLSEMIYVKTRQFPKEEMFGLTSQIRRASISVPSNIAEGHARNSTKQFLQFIGIAQGSLAETETQVFLAQRFDYLTSESATEILNLASEVSRMLAGLRKKLLARE
jgi:four helix bundle protein